MSRHNPHLQRKMEEALSQIFPHVTTEPLDAPTPGTLFLTHLDYFLKYSFLNIVKAYLTPRLIMVWVFPVFFLVYLALQQCHCLFAWSIMHVGANNAC